MFLCPHKYAPPRACSLYVKAVLCINLYAKYGVSECMNSDSILVPHRANFVFFIVRE